MCDFCDPATEQAAKKRARAFADELRALASGYDSLANKAGLAHTDTGALMGLRAKTAIRKLAEDWL